MHPADNVRQRGAWRDKVLPWIYVLAGEALVPLVCVVGVAALLYAMPQAVEALSAVSLAESSDTRSDGWTPVEFAPFISTMLSVVVLAVVVWYSARALVTIDVGALRARANAGGLALEHLDAAARDVPRGLGTFSAIMLCGAFIYALRDGRISDSWYAAASVLSPLLITIAVFTALGFRSRPGVKVVAIAAALLASELILALSGSHDLVSASAAAVIPGLTLAFFILRRSMMARMSTGTIPAAHIPAAYRTRWKLALLALALLLFLCIVARLPAAARRIGSPAIVMLFAAVVTASGSYALLVLRHRAASIPGIGVFTLVAAAAAVALVQGLASWLPLDGSFGREHLVAEPGDAREAAVPPLRKCRPEAGGRRVMVNAYGGGIRAAVFTGQVLARLDDVTDGAFGDCLVASSSVSGGSLGVASYLLLREQYLRAGYWGDCRAPATLEGWVRNELVQDHLSAPLSVLLTVDLLPGVAHRGQALLDSWHQGLMEQVNSVRCGTWRSLGLATPLAQVTGGINPKPRVFFNSTDVVSGSTLWFSNDGSWVTAQQELLKPLDPKSFGSMSVGQAVLHSARFPVVTPSGKFPPDTPDFILLVDGGYADNSGAATLHGQGGDAQLWLNIDGNPKECSDNPLQRSTAIRKEPTALTALLAVRTSQARKAVGTLSNRMQPVTVTLDEGSPDRCPADAASVKRSELQRPAPLGWFITEKTAQQIDKAVAAAVARICTTWTLQCKPLRVAGG